MRLIMSMDNVEENSDRYEEVFLKSHSKTFGFTETLKV